MTDQLANMRETTYGDPTMTTPGEPTPLTGAVVRALVDYNIENEGRGFSHKFNCPAGRGFERECCCTKGPLVEALLAFTTAQITSTREEQYGSALTGVPGDTPESTKGRCTCCNELGLRSTVRGGDVGMSTLMYCEPYYDEDGVRHFHDRNSHSTSFRCSQGHVWHESSQEGCPAPECDWKGRRDIHYDDVGPPHFTSITQED